MVLKLLKKKGDDYKNLPQVLADVDMAGYKNIIVSSINLFPTSEHAMLESIVNGFELANIVQIGTFGVAYMSVILIEPLIDLAVLAGAKSIEFLKDTKFINKRVFSEAI